MATTRRTPVLVSSYEGDIARSNKRGYWDEQLAVMVKEDNPKKVYVYGEVSPSTASTLRGKHGLDAYNKKVNGTDELHVRYLPDEVERIKRETAERGAKRKATIAANKVKAAAEAAKGGKGR